MLIAILGVIVLIVGIVLKRSPEPGNHFGGVVTTVGIVIFVLGIVFFCIQDHRARQSRGTGAIWKSTGPGAGERPARH